VAKDKNTEKTKCAEKIKGRKKTPKRQKEEKQKKETAKTERMNGIKNIFKPTTNKLSSTIVFTACCEIKHPCLFINTLMLIN